MSKMKMTVGARIYLGFGILIVLFLAVFTFIYFNVNKSNALFKESTELSDKISKVYDPSLKHLQELNENVIRSKERVFFWAYNETPAENPQKTDLRNLVKIEIPRNLDDINEVADKWENKFEKGILDTLNHRIDTLFSYYKIVMDTLAEMEDYHDVLRGFTAQDVVTTGGDMDRLFKKIKLSMSDLISRTKTHGREAREQKDRRAKEVQESFNTMLWRIALLGLACCIGAFLISAFTTNSIVKPVREVRSMLQKMGRGIIPQKRQKVSGDEIGDMTLALNNVVDGIQRTTEFSHQVGSGNFEYDYQPLSSEDTLGHALLKMRDDLAENERILEQKVVERTEEVVRQRDELERQRYKLEELYKDVTDSIRYAKRLQDSILPPENFISEILPESFVLFMPKDIVSGDFYWFDKRQGKVLFAAVDCTGHGVPGAFMSLVGANALNQAVREHGYIEPGEIMDDLNKLASITLNKQNEENAVRDGMDMALCSIDRENMVLKYAGANNPLYILRDNEIHITKADKFAIGSFSQEKYNTKEIPLQKGDLIYVFSDGYADQFGGAKGKKFMYKRFRELILSIQNLSMDEQRKKLHESIESWKGSFEQIDDILVIGVRV
jgi:serine phosphatase RsbU (regulator of sigma subunit)